MKHACTSIFIKFCRDIFELCTADIQKGFV